MPASDSAPHPGPTNRSTLPTRAESIRVPRTGRFVVHEPDGAVSEVWLLLHGYGQLADDFLLSCAALAAPGRLLVAPEALSRFYLKEFKEVGASWMTRHEREGEIRDYVEYLDAVLERVCGARSLLLHARAAVSDPAGRAPAIPIRVLGFSQGAATASRWAALGTWQPDRLICWAGDLAHDISEPARALAGIEIDVVFGRRDRLITKEQRQEFRIRMERAGLAFSITEFEGGHRMDDDTLRHVATRAASSEKLERPQHQLGEENDQ